MQTSDRSFAPSQDGRRAGGQFRRAAFFVALAAVAGSLALLFLYTWLRLSAPAPQPVTAAEAALAKSVFLAARPLEYRPWPDAPDLLGEPELASVNDTNPSVRALGADLSARSAIVIDATTGRVLFEKNADDRIPPASMTKLVAMYTAFDAIRAGEISFDDIVDLPAESWASNIPAGSSLMFLAPGHRVTVRELLAGMAVASGNDAAIALAFHVSGSVSAFVSRMNATVQRLGLAETRFVEPSGLSEQNMTTAREFADFAFVYVREYPEALRAFHSQPSIAYPQPWNLPAGSGETPVIQASTNKLLGALDGCDGLKTGFIRESGYNLTLTAQRNGTRFISVTMGGPGSSTYEGNQARSRDGSSLMEWAFGAWRTVRPEAPGPLAVTVWGGDGTSVGIVPAVPLAGTVPARTGELRQEIRLKSWVSAPVSAGDELGTIVYYDGDREAYSVPLVADRNVGYGALPARARDALCRLIAPMFARQANRDREALVAATAVSAAALRP